MGKENALPANLRLKLFGAVLEFMARSGATEAEIRDSFEKGLVGFRSKHRSQCQLSGEKLKLCAELLRLWHRDDRYIDMDAKPRPLPLFKGRNNLKVLLGQLDSAVSALDTLHSMKALGLIRHVGAGRYVPTSDSAIIGQLHPLAVEHVAKTVIQLVGTVRRNTDPNRRSLSLIERVAHIPDLNPSDSKAFAEFTRAQGMAYLQAVDDWLEQRRAHRVLPVKRSKKKGVAAGVHLVAFLGDSSEVAIPRLRRPAELREALV